MGKAELKEFGRQNPLSGYDMLAVWREHAADVRGHAIDSGHFIPEERPDEACRALRDFFATGEAASPGA